MKRTAWRCLALPALAVALCGAVSTEQTALDRISADSLRGNLSFLASDALEGRMTPSRGLTVAAEFIASCYRRAGLEEVNGSYFQLADFVRVTTKLDGFRMKLTSGGEELDLPASDVDIHSATALSMMGAAVTLLPSSAVTGQVVAGDAKRFGNESVLGQLRKAGAGLVLLVSKGHRSEEPEAWTAEASETSLPVIRIYNDDAFAAVTAKRAMTLTLHIEEPEHVDAKVANVLGLLRGSDAALKDEYVVVSAHYDHLGIKDGTIFNGANDNGSGVASVIEMASALAALEPHPRRSILFATFFGEEEGLLGSEYYTHHPLVPLNKTVANINLEQMGRTDESEGKEVGAFAFTGPSYSNLPSEMAAAARKQGVRVYSRRGADSFFDRSDNYAFAEAGVVAHTIAVAFEYPDYHAAGDQWQKIDYANMARVDKAVAAGILEIANRPEAPKWSEIPETARWRKSR
jgi:hypothetical protein